jgi:hypothetical protein
MNLRVVLPTTFQLRWFLRIGLTTVLNEKAFINVSRRIPALALGTEEAIHVLVDEHDPGIYFSGKLVKIACPASVTRGDTSLSKSLSDVTHVSER